MASFGSQLSPKSVSRSESESTTRSDTLSDFIRSRYRGEVPVFGGNPRNGFRDVGRALAGSAGAGQREIVTAMNNLTAALRDAASPGFARGRAASQDSRIDMFDAASSSMFDDDSESFEKASQMDPERLRLLLDASMVDAVDVNSYFLLMDSARRSIRKKVDHMQNVSMRRLSRLSTTSYVQDSELDVDNEGVNTMHELLNKTGLLRVDVARALTHDSAFGGRETNRAVAMLGDVVLRLMLIQRAINRSVSVGDISRMITLSQSNENLKLVGQTHSLHNFVIAALNMDTTSKRVIATTVEAFYGVAYQRGGIEEAERVDEFFKLMDVINSVDESQPAPAMRQLAPSIAVDDA